MKKEIIKVPKDKCPLDVLAELGERTRNSWIFLDHSSLRKLKDTADWIQPHLHTRSNGLHWNATKDYPSTTIEVENRVDRIWLFVRYIKAEDIAFQTPPQDPDELFFLKMEA